MLELISGIGAALVVRIHGVSPLSMLFVIGVVAVALAAMTDIEFMIIPDRLSGLLAGVALLGMAPLVGGVEAMRVFAAWAVGFPLSLHLLCLALVRIGTARPIGGGDVKLLVGVLALASGVPSGPGVVLIVAVLAAGSIASLGLLTGRLRRGDRLPFAPAIALGYGVVVLSPSSAGWIAETFGGVA